MRLELTGRHVDVSPTIRALVERKLARLERLLDHRALSSQVVLTAGKRLLRADVTLHARGERFLHGCGEASVWDDALTEAADKIVQQARKLKGKRQARKRRPLVSPSEPGPVATALPARTPVRMPRVLRTARQTVRELSVGEAARRVDGDSDLLVFRDTENGALSVLYRSPAGELVLVVTNG